MITLAVIPSSSSHVLNRESAIVRGGVSKVLTNSRLLKLNFGIMCLHILLMSSFVALPRVMEQAGLAPQHHWKVYLVTMLVSFAAVVPFVIYAEVKRRMKQVFIACVMILIAAELVLLQAGNHALWQILIGIQLFFLGFNVMEALLPSLISKESPAGYKGTAMGSIPPPSSSGWRLAAASAALCMTCMAHRWYSARGTAGASLVAGQLYHAGAALSEQPAHYLAG